MMNRGLIVGALLSTMTVGCVAGEEDDIDTLEFRSANDDEGAWWEPDLTYAGNGDIEIRGGDDDDDLDDPDTIIWDIDGAGVSRQIIGGGFNETLIVSDTVIASANIGAQSTTAPGCMVVEGDHPNKPEYQLLNEQGEVVFTMRKRRVYAGDLGPGNCNTPAVTFKGKKIFLGPWQNNEPVAIASEKIAKASPVRRLLLAALVTGECGSQGLE